MGCVVGVTDVDGATDREREVERVTDGEREDDCRTDEDAGRDGEPEKLRDIEVLRVVLRVTDASMDVDAVTLRDCVELAVTEPGMLTLSVTEREEEGVCVVLADIERDKVTLLDSDRLALNDALSVRLTDTDDDAVALGVKLADPRHMQHALVVTRQLSSISAPLTNEPGESTPTQAPAPVGSACPADGVPHRLSLLARKYDVERPDAHDQLDDKRDAVGAAADNPVQ